VSRTTGEEYYLNTATGESTYDRTEAAAEPSTGYRPPVSGTATWGANRRHYGQDGGAEEGGGPETSVPDVELLEGSTCCASGWAATAG
jgi:hypothetical protein